jgi:histidinol-phosphatase (PHP family)
MIANYHSHSNYCDGSSPLEDYIIAAINLGFEGYGFSSHAPLPFPCQWAMPQNQLQDYFRRINYLKEKWQDEIKIFRSLEIDYIPSLTGPNHAKFTSLPLDYTIGSIHFIEQFSDGTPWAVDSSHRKFLIGLEEIFKGDIVRLVKKYFSNTRKMVREETPTIVGHLDKIKMHNLYKNHFNEQEDWYREEIDYTLNTIKTAGSLIEINTRGNYRLKSKSLYPSNWILEEIAAKSIPIVLNSDAHMPSEINLGFDYALSQLKQIGFKSLKNFDGIDWIDTPVEEIIAKNKSHIIPVEQLRK